MTTAAIAGGQSLLPMLNLRVALVDLLVDIAASTSSRRVTEIAEAALHIGALTTHAAIEDGAIPDRSAGCCGTSPAHLVSRDPQSRHDRRQRRARRPGGRLAGLPDGARRHGADRRPERHARQSRSRISCRGLYTTSLASGEIILGFDVPRPAAPLRWGFAKVTRKSGAFANSIAFVVAQGEGRPVRSCSARRRRAPIVLPTRRRTWSRARISTRRAARRDRRPTSRRIVPDADAYQQRLHTSTVLRAIREMRAQMITITLSSTVTKVTHAVEPRETLADSCASGAA